MSSKVIKESGGMHENSPSKSSSTESEAAVRRVVQLKDKLQKPEARKNRTGFASQV